MTLARALSGTLTGTCDNTSYKLTCEWSATQSVANNTSTITAKVYLQAPSGWSTISSNWSCVINGTTVTSSKSATVSSTKVLLGSRTWTVTHASNGTLSTTISFSYSNGLSSAGTYTTKKGSGSSSVTLNTIPRTSSFTLSSSSLDMGGSQTVKITKASSSFTHTIQYTFGDTTTTVVTKTGNESYSFTPPVSLASKITTATSGTCTVKVTTYSGDTNIGSTSKTFTLKVPSSVKPSVTLATTYNNTLGGVSIAGKSTVKVVPTGTGSHGSTIKSYSYSGAGLSGTGSSKTTGTLSAGSYTITVTATDSRGRTGSANVSFTIYAYSAPSLSISAYRCDESGNKTANGTYARAKLTYTISNPNNNNANAKQYKIEKKTSTASSYTIHKDWTNFTGGYTSTADSILDLGSGFANTTSYDIKISIRDSYSTASATQRISTINALLNLEKNGVGIGKIYEQGVLDVGGEIRTSGFYTSNGNGKTLKMGTGASDVYIHNSASGKYLQLKDNGTLAYSDRPILMGTVTSSGNRWGVYTMIGDDGVMEVGKYLDFHASDGNTGDFNTRLYSEGGNIVCSGAFYPNGQHTARMGYHSTDKCAYISNANSNWFRLNDDGSMTWRGQPVMYNNCTGSFTLPSGSITVGDDSKTDGRGFISRRYEADTKQAAKLMLIGTGNGYAAVVHRNETTGFELSLMTRATSGSSSGVTGGEVVPSVTNIANLGTSTYKWKAVYATNGTIQTSDERFKVKRGYADTQECYELVKNTPIYNYISLGENKEELSKSRLGKIALKNSGEEINVHMGIMAQDIQKYECSKQILIEGEYEKVDGTKDTMLHVNPYNLTSAIMGALQEDIKRQEVLEQSVVTLKLENQNLKQELAELKTTVQTILNSKGE